MMPEEQFEQLRIKAMIAPTQPSFPGSNGSRNCILSPCSKALRQIIQQF